MNDRDAAMQAHPSALPPVRVWSPTFSFAGVHFPSPLARTAFDGHVFRERLGDREQYTARMRTENGTPVPMSDRVTSADWQALDAMLGGAM